MKRRAYLALGRPSNLPTVWTDVLAGTALAGAAPSARTALTALAASLLYTGGMFLNDAFDRRVDAVERPDRPIPSGAASAAEAFGVGFALLGAGVLLAGPARGTALVLAAAIVLYDARHKKNPIAPLIMGACRGLVYLMAADAAAGAIGARVVLGAAALAAWVVGLTYAARRERSAGLGSWWPMALLAVPLLAGAGAWGEGWLAIAVWLGLLAWALRALVHLRAAEIGRAVVALIAGISLVDAVLIASAGAPWLALAATLGVPATLRLQRWVRGT